MWGQGWVYKSTEKDLEGHIPNIYSQNTYVVLKATEEEKVTCNSKENL